jgi:hypothetical protein
MQKETRKIDGNDVIVTWSDWQGAGDGEQQRYILAMDINGAEWDMREGKYERFACGEVKNTDGSVIGVYPDGEPLEGWKDPVVETFKKVPGAELRPCALCGKLGLVVLVDVTGEAEAAPWWRLEVLCPDACDEGGTGEENILFSSQDLGEVEEWARANGIGFD